MTTKKKIKKNLLAISIGIVYIWFGSLKFVPNLSPAESLAKDTINELTFGLIPPDESIVLLAIWETGVGIMLILNIFKPLIFRLAILHIICTFTPLLFFPEQIFINGPFGLTLLGQYITKNIIIFSVLLYLSKGSTIVTLRMIKNEIKSFI